ncbi:hypothetical protein FN846DRAFT_906862 [Sphaerosporella brunnea]|uniref:Uncharacterized protein n=1 Tax=Sphaerosporella brunnea TaxID=1250544 RepID=A0A5J5EXU3_9PEZI|nr:hypothetical protein FN846DRAFT_906862 [Sphaerosporella brunnea]
MSNLEASLWLEPVPGTITGALPGCEIPGFDEPRTSGVWEHGYRQLAVRSGTRYWGGGTELLDSEHVKARRHLHLQHGLKAPRGVH